MVSQTGPSTFPAQADPGPITTQGGILLLGDVDCDVDVDTVDALGTLQHIAAVSSPDCIESGDVNCSGALDAVDALAILRHVGGLPVDQNQPCPQIGDPLGDQEFPDLAGPTSGDLIEDALEAGDIDEETALLYRVYAEFGDERLPAQYEGDDRDLIHGDAVWDAVEQFDGLSPATQELLQPFLLPPNAPGSWENQRSASTAGGPASPPDVTDWQNVSAVNGQVLVWYGQEEHASAAQEVAAAMEQIWPALTGLMGREPISDVGEEHNGAGGEFDIYLTDLGTRASSVQYHSCVPTAAFTRIDPDAGPNSLGQAIPLRSSAVHEFMHVLQFTYDYAQACSEYRWWWESAANWARYYVFPDDNSYHPEGREFLKTLHQPLESKDPIYRPYGSYLFPFFLTENYGDNSIIPAIHERMQFEDSLAAINSVVPGGFEETWHEFVAHAWNPTWSPLNKFREWDSFTGRARGQDGFRPREVSLSAGNPDDRIEMPVELTHLSTEYYHFEFPDDSVSSVVFHNGWTFALSEFNQEGVQALIEESLSEEDNEGLKVEALIKLEGQDWVRQDVSNQPGIALCRDQADERLEELVLIYSNSNHENRGEVLGPVDLDPTLWVSNIGCWGWEGTASATIQSDGVTHTAHATARFEASDSPALSAVPAGPPGFPDLPPDVTVLIGLSKFYQPVSGSIEWSVSGTDSSGCTHSGSGEVPLGDGMLSSALYTLNGALGGTFYRGYGGVMTPGALSPPTYAISCPDGPKQGIASPVITIVGEPIPAASADGGTLSGSFVGESGQYEWNFTALRE